MLRSLCVRPGGRWGLIAALAGVLCHGSLDAQQELSAKEQIKVMKARHELLFGKLDEERAALAKEREQLERKLTALREVQGWATRDFRDARLPSKLADPNDVPIIKHYERIQQVSARQFVDLPPDANIGAIGSGRALNFFLDALGDAALQHDQALNGREQHLASIDGSDRSFYQQYYQVLAGMDEGLRLPKRQLQEVVCEYGLKNPKITMRLTSPLGEAVQILPLEPWPIFFSSNPRFAPHIKAVTEARAEMLEEMAAGEFAGDGMHRLMRTVDELHAESSKLIAALHENSLVRGYSNSRLRTGQSTGAAAEGQKDYQVIAGQKHLKTLRYGLSRLVESRAVWDQAQSASLQPVRFSGTDEVTVVEILSFMKTNGLRFGAATPGSEVAYRRLYERMVEYYRSMLDLQGSVHEIVNETQLTDAQIQQHIQNAYRVEQQIIETEGTADGRARISESANRGLMQGIGAGIGEIINAIREP